jgi:Transposase IS200 like
MENEPQTPGFLVWEHPIEITGSTLPHWEQMGACYFVTFRLADSVPRELWGQFDMERHAWLAMHPEPWDDKTEAEFHQRFSGQLEQWLDQGMGACVLREPACAEMVCGALKFFEGERVTVYSFVVMPNHVHVLFQPLAGYTLAQLLHSWKRFSAREINQRLGQLGSLWQADYFDRLIRDWTHFGRVVTYIRRNPEKAKLPAGECLLWESAWIKQQFPPKERGF